LPKADLDVADTALRRKLKKNAPPARLSANRQTETIAQTAATGLAKVKLGVVAKARETATVPAKAKAVDEATVRATVADHAVEPPTAPLEPDRASV
jgi:hypothetical protein